MSALHHAETRTDADRCVSVLLHLYRLRGDAEAKVRRLLRVLFLWLRAMSADPGRAFRTGRRFAMLCRIALMAGHMVETSRDWLGSPRASLLAWWIPSATILASLFAPVAVRTAIWSVALIWMGTACLLNAKQCGRTHCRYTGPYYLAMVVPTLALGFGLVPADIYGWLGLAGVILLGSKLIWWSTERAWGNSHRSDD